MRKATICILALACASVRADETADRLRAAATGAQGSVFTLKVVLEIQIHGQTQEIKPQVPVLLLDGTGLLVSPNPEAMINAPAGLNLNIEAKSYQLVLPDGKELEARSVGRDAELGLLFLRLTAKDAPALGAPPATRAKPVELGDELYVVRRLSSTHPEPFCNASRVVSVVQKPRLMYLVSETSGAGGLVLSTEGEVVGLTSVVKEQDPDSGRSSQMLVVLPFSQVLETAKGIHEEPAEEKPKEPEGKGEKEPTQPVSPEPTEK